jgi:hypothetical protein
VAQQACPLPPQGPQVPASPCPALRPEQASVAPVQVPLLPVPQQGWPVAPHAPHSFPAVPTRQASGVMQAVIPASAAAPAVEQHTCPAPPQVLQVPGIPCAAFRAAQPSPALQVPLLPFPQQICPEAPQAAEHLSPVAETTQVRPVLHSVWPGQHG